MTGWTGHTVRRARDVMAARLPLPCHLCGRVVDARQLWVVEHVIPRALGGSVTDPSNWAVSHRRCSDASGSRVRVAKSRKLKAPDDGRVIDRGIPW